MKTRSIPLVLALCVIATACGYERGHTAARTKGPLEVDREDIEIAFKRRCHEIGECEREGNGIFGLRRDRRPRLVRLTSHPSDRDPAWSRDGERLAFARCKRGDCDLWTLDLATSKEARVTTGPRVDVEPTWSPDGGTLAFQRCSTGKKARNSCELWTVGVDGTSQRRLTYNDVADGHPDWSWRFDEIVFDRGDCPSGTTSCRRSAIFVMPGGGGPERRLAASARGAWEPRWDRTRRRIVYDACQGLCSAIDDLQGSPLVVLDLRRGPRLVRIQWELVFSPSFSRHGRRLLYAVFSGDNGAVSDHELKGERERGFYSNYAYHAYAPDWRPSRKRRGHVTQP